MRKFLLLAAAAAIPVLVAAPANSAGAGVSLSVSGYKVMSGHGLHLSGRLGTGQPGQHVAILARRYGNSAPIRLATVTTSAGGHWHFVARPTVQTTYVVRSGVRSSRSVTIGVRPSVVVRELPNGRIWTQVSAGRSLKGAVVQLQRGLAGGGWQTIATKPLSSASIAVFPAPAASIVRVALSVNQAGPGLLGTVSHGLVYHFRSLTISPSTYKVLYGHRLTLSGRLLGQHAGKRVTIYARPYGRSGPRRVASVRTGAHGAWTYLARPGIQTTYQARWAGGSSPQVTVGVRPLISVRALHGGRVWTRVTIGHSLRGRTVKLQRLVAGGGWETIAQKPLGRASAAIFTVGGPGSIVRVAFSVNEAGKGYLGSASHPLAHRAV
jgi:hypothetical protein